MKKYFAILSLSLCATCQKNDTFYDYWQGNQTVKIHSYSHSILDTTSGHYSDTIEGPINIIQLDTAIKIEFLPPLDWSNTDSLHYHILNSGHYYIKSLNENYLILKDDNKGKLKIEPPFPYSTYYFDGVYTANSFRFNFGIISSGGRSEYIIEANK
ncbi:MAG: hypothetical protein IPK03_04575 [Bacteroidetes bacterium]|nr:hypothetical protein [Bacteroidota bacterium]